MSQIKVTPRGMSPITQEAFASVQAILDDYGRQIKALQSAGVLPPDLPDPAPDVSPDLKPAPTPEPAPKEPPLSNGKRPNWWNEPRLRDFLDLDLSPGPVVHVSKSGYDTASGTRTAPVKTIHEGLNRARRHAGKGPMVVVDPGDYHENDGDGGATNVIKHEVANPDWHSKRWLTVMAADPANPPTVWTGNHEGGFQARGDMIQLVGMRVRSGVKKPNPYFSWYGGGITTGGKYRSDGVIGSAFFRIIGCDVEGMMGGGFSHGQTSHHIVAFNRSVKNAFFAPKAHSAFSFWKAHKRKGQPWTPYAGNYTDIWYGNYSFGNDNLIPYDWGNGQGKTRTDGNHFIADLNDYDYITGEKRPYGGKILVACDVGEQNGGKGVHAFKSSGVDAVACTMIQNNARIGQPLVRYDDIQEDTAMTRGYEFGAATYGNDLPSSIRVGRNVGVVREGAYLEKTFGTSTLSQRSWSYSKSLSDFVEGSRGVPKATMDHEGKHLVGALRADGSYTHTLDEAAAVI